MWFKKPINIGITAGAVVLAAVAIFLVIWGVVHHTEGEMLQVCWSDDGQPGYVDTSQIEGGEPHNGSCDRPEELVWPQKQIPITVAATTPDGEELGPDSYEGRALAQAIADFNSQVGFSLLRVERELLSASTVTRFGGAFQARGTSPPPGQVTHRRLAGGELRAVIYIRSDVVADSRLLHLVLLHEFGHLAGLAHDDFTLSIMFPLSREEWSNGEMSMAHVTDRDKVNLRQRYHID